ncbi:MAG: transglutaminase-like domain-containing protein [Planctomycetota bacterium]|jgi:hypothetical protein
MKLVNLTVFLICSVLTTAYGGPAVEETGYFALFMEGKKVGHAIQVRRVAEGKVTTSEEVTITISRMNVPVTMNMKETTIETTDGKPLSFESIQDIGLMVMRVVGMVNTDGTVELITSSMGAAQKETMQWPEGALMAEGLRLLELKKGMKKGTTYKVRLFSPGIMQAVDVEVSVGQKRNVDLLGRVVQLTEVTTNMILPGSGSILSTSYVDDDFSVQKTMIPMAGMQIEMIACVKEFALSKNDVLDVLDRMFLVSPVSLDDPRSAESISYYLSPTDPNKKLNVPVTDNQSVRQGEGKSIVTVKPVVAPAGIKLPYRGNEPELLQALKPARYVQSDNDKILKLARVAVGRTKDATQAARKIEAFVANYIENKSLSVGYGSAVDVADSKMGDCSEFAVLTTAMCRAVCGFGRSFRRPCLGAGIYWR